MSEAITLSPASIDAIVERLAARLREAPPTPTAPAASPHDLIDMAEAMRMTGTKSPRALYRTLKTLSVRRVAHGKYRRGDIENAISRASLRKA
jgi:hypothetical protein